MPRLTVYYVPMSENSYFKRAQAVWDELRALLVKGRWGPRRLSAEELDRLDRLYRLSAIHLAQVQTRTSDRGLLHDLNRLVAKAHSFIYVAPKRSPLREVVIFYLNGFARVVARTWPYHLAAVLLFLFGLVAGYGAAMIEPLAAYALGPADERLPGSSREQLEAVLRSGRDAETGEKFMFASFLLTHNTKVGFTAFASGVLGGVPSVMLIVLTGASVGAFAAIHARQGIVAELWAWLLPHGVTELGAAILCGGAGLMLGMALLRPAHQSRTQSLRTAGQEALRIALGVIPMFVFAGIIESFLRQSYLSTETRLAFALMTALLWTIYFTFGFVMERLALRWSYLNRDSHLLFEANNR